MSTKITRVHARQIIDSRGNPTVEADVYVSEARGRAAVPSGASTGEHEALELRDADKSRYLGKGVLKAVASVNGELAKAVAGLDAADQRALDKRMIELDGTPEKSRLGANAILAVSMAAARAAAAAAQKLPLYKYLAKYSTVRSANLLPVPMMNILNGGAHADSSVDFQEFMVMPVGAPSFSEALRWGVEIFHSLKSALKKHGYSTAVGDEGGFAPSCKSNEEAIQIVLEAIGAAGYKPGEQVSIALDPASSEFYDKSSGKYVFKKSDKSAHSSAEMAAYWTQWVAKYPIVSIEDGMAEDDWAGWKQLTQSVGAQIVEKENSIGGRRFVCHEYGAAVARDQRRHRQRDFDQAEPDRHGDGNDRRHRAGAQSRLQLHHFASLRRDGRHFHCRPGSGHSVAGQIKTGSACRTDRIAKYNQLLRIEEEVGRPAQNSTAATLSWDSCNFSAIPSSLKAMTAFANPRSSEPDVRMRISRASDDDVPALTRIDQRRVRGGAGCIRGEPRGRFRNPRLHGQRHVS